ncbi:glycosyltransferase [Megalodesulfovibrio gigas]|uniref:Putative glycosyl transferase group 1 n=1 Tax=Megalodesulfovibrio gigas (strain ATCC 19364 / DSM 1382 / NCIMB 9332 / VKM B-1759) TaxID=1121448 RepID=T2GC88_MEGG1|nr:glycosyltransferase [Megalodesulfovibrio gigas]AGW13918.1 putative glycosyl transferase group 1 [Megalodesulfovibrio gigas DSM 1382 = ATCC 19364]
MLETRASSTPALPGVLHHSFLERRGGAARVADLLCAGMQCQGVETARSFEIVQSEAGQRWMDDWHGDWFAALEAAIRRGWLLHLHGSGDWLGLLERLLPLASKVCITFHDMRLATGGCVFPTDCPGLDRACADPCPRGLPDTAARRQHAAALLHRLQPLALCPSQWGCDLLRQAIPGLAPRLAPNGIPWPAALPDKRAAKQAIGLSPAARLAVFVAHGGEAAGVKAGDTWLRLWDRIKQAAPQAVGYLIGGTAHSRQGDLVRWPYLESEALSRMFAAADCLVYPSWADNHPLTVLEAMAQGCPVTAWAAGGIAEMVIPDATGKLLPVGDLDGLAREAAALLTHPSHGRQLAMAAHRAGLRHFAADGMTRAVLRLLAQQFGQESGNKPNL